MRVWGSASSAHLSGGRRVGTATIGGRRDERPERAAAARAPAGVVLPPWGPSMRGARATDAGAAAASAASAGATHDEGAVRLRGGLPAVARGVVPAEEGRASRGCRRARARARARAGAGDRERVQEEGSSAGAICPRPQATARKVRLRGRRRTLTLSFFHIRVHVRPSRIGHECAGGLTWEFRMSSFDGRLRYLCMISEMGLCRTLRLRTA